MGTVTPFEQLTWLQANAYQFSIEVNDHRSYYDPIEKAVAEQKDGGFIDDAMGAECIERKQMVVIQCYLYTPIGFFRVVDHDLARAVGRTYDTAKTALDAKARKL